MGIWEILNRVNKAIGNSEPSYDVNFNQDDITPHHGVAGIFGHKDAEWQEFEEAWQQHYGTGEISRDELGEAWQKWRDAEQKKPAWKWLLGL